MHHSEQLAKSYACFSLLSTVDVAADAMGSTPTPGHPLWPVVLRVGSVCGLVIEIGGRNRGPEGSLKETLFELVEAQQQ